MKTIIIRLIREEIKTTRLVRHLERGGFDAKIYLPESSRCIFDLAGIQKEWLDDPALRESYSVMIEKIAAEPLINTHDLLHKSSEILGMLESWKAKHAEASIS